MALLLTFAVAYNIPRFFEISWEPLSYEEAKKSGRVDFDANLNPSDNITTYVPTSMRINDLYIRLTVLQIDVLEKMQNYKLNDINLFDFMIKKELNRKCVFQVKNTSE